MPDAKTLMNEINEVTIAQREGLKHDAARMAYKEPMLQVRTQKKG